MDGDPVSLYNGTLTPIIEFAPDDGLFAASPTWVEITDYVRRVPMCSSTSRTNELDDFQPGMFVGELDNRARTFDPAYGPASVTFPNAAANYWSCGDLAAFAAATELDVRACVSLDDWTPAANSTIASQYGAAGQRSWSVGVNTNGYLRLITSSDGTATVAANSGCRIAAVDGQTVCVRVTWDSSNAVYFYVKRTIKGRERADCLSHDGWVQLGVVKVGVAAALHNSTTAVQVGRAGDATEPLDGTVYYCDARTTIGSDTLAFAFWPADAASTAATSWVSTQGAGETWTQTGTTTLAIQGPYFGRLTPGTPLRVRATYGATTYDVWYGYVRRWPQMYPRVGTDSVARVEAVDALGWLAEKPAPETPFGIAVDAWNRAQQIALGNTESDPYWPMHEPFPAQQFAGGNAAAGGGQFVGDVTQGAITQPGAPSAATRAFGQTSTQLAQASATGTIPTGPGTFYSPSLSFWCDVPDATSQFEVISGALGLSFVADPVGIGATARTYVQMDTGGAGTQNAWVIPHLAPGPHLIYVSYSGTIMVQVDGTEQPTSEVGTIIRATDGLYPTLWVSGYGSVGGGSVSDVTMGRGTSDLTGYDAYYSGTGRPLELSGDRMEWLLTAAGIPTALQSVTTDACTYLGPQPANSTYGAHCKAVETAENGRLFVAGNGAVTFRSHQWATTATAATTSQHTFGDGAGESPYADLVVDPNNVDDIVNSASVSTPTGGGGSYRDEASIALHGEKSISKTAPLPTSVAATNLAIQLATVRNWPTVRVENLTVNPLSPGHEATLWPQVLGRGIGERITVKRSPTSTLVPSVTTSTINAQVTIEGIRHAWDSERWTTVWNTAPAPLTAQEAGHWTPDDAVLGVLDSGVTVAY
jgi:hypothetical protein